jgi:nucleoside-diphosphate-sugar epimerase
MSILVTGATGFVMANLTRHLAEQGHAVVAADC